MSGGKLEGGGTLVMKGADGNDTFAVAVFKLSRLAKSLAKINAKAAI